jgi:hypothetical protein
LKRPRIRHRTRQWTSCLLIMALLLTLMPPFVAHAAGSRITITNLYIATDISSGKPSPAEDNNIPRFTSNPITLKAATENISDAQVSSIYYEITNVSTGITSVEKSNKAFRAPGSFEITFNNVTLTEGLNKVSIKLGDTSTIESAPAWAYFTPTTAITDLSIDGAPFLDNKIYPENPLNSTMINISGKAPNAVDVQAYVLGDAMPKSAFFNNGEFFFIADDINKTTSTANFRVKPGDNPLTIIASNRSKSYQVEKNLIYDNGNPFAFNAAVRELTKDEQITMPGDTTTKIYLQKQDVIASTVEVWTGTGKTGTRVTGVNVGQDAATKQYYLTFSNANAGTAYVTYYWGAKKLITSPTVTSSNLQISALLKNNLNELGEVRYRYVDVYVAGKKYGPYDLSGAQAATSATALYPTVINQGYTTTFLSLVGTALESDVTVTYEDKNGASTDLTVNNTTNPSYTNKDKTIKLYTLPAGSLTLANAPYKFIVKKSDRILKEFSVQVVDAGALPTVDIAATDTQLAGLKEGYGPINKTVTFGSTVTGTEVRVDVTDLTGQILLGTAYGTTPNGTVISFPMPTGLVEGQYKARISYSGNILTERYFTIGARDAATPTVSSVTTTTLPDFTPVAGAAASPTFLYVKGSNLGTKLSAIDTSSAAVSPRLVNQADATNVISLTAYDIRDDQIIFRLADQSALTDGATYDLLFTHAATALTVASAAASQPLTVGATYAGEVIANFTPLQLTRTEVQQAATAVTITGQSLTKDTMLVEIFSEAGAAQPSAVVESVNDAKTEAVVKLPTSLAIGNYVVRISAAAGGTTNFLAQYPLAVISPSMTRLDPAVKAVTASTPTEMTVTGTELGRYVAGITPSPHLKLRFKSDENAQQPISEESVKRLEGGSRATFNLPSLPEGTYTVTLLYNNSPVGGTLKYTVSSPPATLKENAEWSKPNRYKVFEFKTDVAISTDKYQLVEFKFYNFATDNVPPTSFYFNYIDPNLPYVDHIRRLVGTAEITMSDSSANEINEQPATMYIYTDTKTKKVNVYLGDYNSNSVPYATLASANPATATINNRTYNKFTLNLSGIPDGPTKLTAVPSLNSTTDTTMQNLATVKSGENAAGSKVYDLTVTSTPYVIVNNIYNGMVVKDPVSEITCTSGGQLKGNCISGRLVNVPITDYDNVEVYINEQKTNLKHAVLPSDFSDPAAGKFNLQLGAARGINFKETDGENTVKILIYRTIGGVKRLVTEASFKVFVFREEVSEFVTITPIETTDVVKYTRASTPDAYVTTENGVAFSGQFVNANEIKLTVRRKGENGQPIVKYDRRYNNFTAIEPVNGNPGYFRSINAVTGHFTTNAINLDQTGDTIFEFTITNNSGIRITKTITVTREPRPYTVIYPKLIRNGKGEDQANINSNYIEIELEAENADKVVFGKDTAVVREAIDSFGNKIKRFYYEAADLKPGTNKIQFTVFTGEESIKGSFVLYNADTPIEGAQYKTKLKNKLRVFDDLVQLSFPRGTNFMRNDAQAVNQFLTEDRKILFGIANKSDGRVDKYKHPAAGDGQLGNPNPLISPEAKLLLTEPTGRFRSAGELVWIDAGTIAKNETDINKALNGSGRLPYDNDTFYTRSLSDLVVPTQRGELTLKYDPIIRTDAWKYVTVFHFDIYEDHTGVTRPRWRNLGGVVDAVKNTITVPFDRFGYYQVMYMDQSFDDVTAHPWARDFLNTLYSKGMMLPKSPPSAFVPNDPISRGEFATLLVKIFDIPLTYTEDPTFSDVLRVNPLTNGLYDYKYIETAAAAGIVRGYTGGRFLPDNSLTRQDAAVMIAKAANLKLNSSGDRVLKSLLKTFTDAKDINLYARSSVEAIAKAKLIQGKENVLLQGQTKTTYRYDPLETFTRAEASAVAINILKQQKKIPK